MRQQLKQEREKINQPEHTASCSQNKGSEQFQRRASWLRPAHPRWRQEAGERGKLGPTDGIPYHIANRPPVSNQRLREILDGRHPTSAGRAAAKHKVHAPDRWGRGGEKARRTRGECACQAPGRLSCSGWGRHKTQAQPSLRFCGHPKTGPARHAGPAPYRAAGSLSSVDGEGSAPPPRSATEAANLNQRPPLPACVRAEIRHGRDPQTEAK